MQPSDTLIKLRETTDNLEQAQLKKIKLLRGIYKAVVLNELFGTGKDTIDFSVVRKYNHGRFMADKIDTVFIRVNGSDKFEATREQIQFMIDQGVIDGSL